MDEDSANRLQVRHLTAANDNINAVVETRADIERMTVKVDPINFKVLFFWIPIRCPSW